MANLSYNAEPLPTTLYTVIKVTWLTGFEDLVVLGENGWRVASRQGGEPDMSDVSSFKIVAVPVSDAPA